MIKAIIKVDGEEYEGVLSKLTLYHSTNETVYGGMICVGDNLRIEFDYIPEKDIKIIYNDASNKEVKQYWEYSNSKGAYVCPICGVEQKITTPFCPCCGTEFINYGRSA